MSFSKLHAISNKLKADYEDFDYEDFANDTKWFNGLVVSMNKLNLYLDIRQGDIDCLGESYNGIWIACFFYKYKINNETYYGIGGPWSGKHKSMIIATALAAKEAVGWLNDK